jgi:Protein of unknown function (DUF2934)
MKTNDAFLDERGVLASETRPHTLGTQDHNAIRRWAARHGAEPATGEATASGPATVDVRDRGAGIRFNFPAAARFRPITWEEWFDNFDRHQLVFVYEEEVADRAYQLWQARGCQHGQDLDDWLEAERQLGMAGSSHPATYRLVRAPAFQAQSSVIESAQSTPAPTAPVDSSEASVNSGGPNAPARSSASHARSGTRARSVVTDL